MKNINISKKLSLALITILSVGVVVTSQADASMLYENNSEQNEINQVYIKGTEAQLANISPEVVEFVKEIALDAHLLGNYYGVYPSVTIAQAILESSVGKSKLAKYPNNNLFGMKGAYHGKSVDVDTLEDDGSGNMYKINAKFKKYPNKGESLRDHGKLLREGLGGFYQGTWRENANSPKAATDFLQGRYASDSKYSAKLMKLIKDYNLERFDNNLTNRDLAWLSSESLDPWEVPVIENKEVKLKNEIWNNNLRAVSQYIPTLIVNKDTYNYNYIINNFEVHEDFTSQSRYKGTPQVGDIVVYKFENSSNPFQENYAVIKGVYADAIVISEGSNEFKKEIYRIIPTEDLAKSEFISINSITN